MIRVISGIRWWLQNHSPALIRAEEITVAYALLLEHGAAQSDPFASKRIHHAAGDGAGRRDDVQAQSVCSRSSVHRKYNLIGEWSGQIAVNHFHLPGPNVQDRNSIGEMEG